MLNFIFESLFVPDIVPEKFPSRYPTFLRYVDIVNVDEKESILKQTKVVNHLLMKWSLLLGVHLRLRLRPTAFSETVTCS